jgi:hypothetical protein
MMQVGEDKIRCDSALFHGLIAESSVREKVVPSLRDSLGVPTYPALPCRAFECRPFRGWFC